MTVEDAAERRAAIAAEHAVESRDERRRRRSRERAARSRERKREREQALATESREDDERASVERGAAEHPLPAQDERVRRGSSSGDGKLLGIVGLPRPGNAQLGYPTTSEVLYKRGQRGETLSREQWLAQPREPAPTGIRVLLTDAEGTVREQFGLRLLSDDPLDRLDIGTRADFLSEATGLDRNDVLERLHRTPQEGTCIFVLAAPE